MQRIDTATAVQDLFGAGKHGFGDTPPNQTQLDAAFFNNVQEEIARVIENAGGALDGLTLDQLWTTLQSFPFGGDVVIESTGSLTVDLGASLQVDGTATFTNDFTVTSQADFTLGIVVSGGPGEFDAGIVVSGSPATLNTQAQLNAGGTVASGQTLAGADATTTINGFGTIEAALVQSTTVGRLKSRKVEVEAGGTKTASMLTNTAGLLLWGTGEIVHTSSEGYLPKVEDFQASAGPTVNSINDSGCEATIELTPTTRVRVTAYIEGTNDNVAVGDCNFRIEVDNVGGDGPFVIGGSNYVIVHLDDRYEHASRRFEWQPNESFGAPVDPDDYTFKVRYGAQGGGNASVQNVAIEIQVLG